MDGPPIAESVEEPLEEVTPVPEDTEDIRYEMTIPDNIAIVQDTSNGLTPETAEHTFEQSVEPVAAETVETITIELPPVETPSDPVRPRRTRRNTPRVYTVSDGDNLGSIARKFYGPEEGNRLANSLKIFEANRGVLESPHKLVIGQKIVVPPLKTPKSEKDKPDDATGGSLFERVKSIGSKILPAADKPKPAPEAKQSRQYTVQEDDSLWQIAAKQLGDPVRYKEIVKMNPGVLKDENTTLKIGMNLSLPAR